MTPVTVDMFGPMSDDHHFIVVDGYRLPYLVACPADAKQTQWEILLDKRLGIMVDTEHLTDYLSFLADCMAVAAGYKSHSDACEHQRDRYNPFGTRVMQLTPEQLEGTQPDAAPGSGRERGAG